MQTGAHEKLADCTIDILFHMDKIAMHQLNVSLSRLVIELQRAKYNSINSNGLFEIYTYYHFENFVWARNRKHCSPAIIERLKINVDVEEASGVALSQQQELYGLLTDLQIETSHFMASSSQEQSQLLAQQIQLEITVKQFCENPSHEGLERAIWVTEQFDHQLEPQPDAWNKVHPILKCILGVLSLITLVPAVIVELTTSQGYINTFFKNESKKIQSVSDVPESSPDLGYKSER